MHDPDTNPLSIRERGIVIFTRGALGPKGKYMTYIDPTFSVYNSYLFSS
jgi:hypothetical protein